MANVFTKRNNRARTTTLRDFAFKRNYPVPPRVLSPTRRCNPHPTGLVTQSPYNRDNATYDIWNPDFNKIQSRMTPMLQHLYFQNFCSGPILQANKTKEFPEIKYSLATTMRTNFQKPVYPINVPHTQNTTRFGCTKYRPGRGIVPNTLPPISRPSSAAKS